MDISTTIENYKTELYNLLKDIPFASGTLESGSIISTYEKSRRDRPITEINITNRSINSNMIESKLNNRIYTIIIRISCYISNREQKAQQDMDYLEESIIEILEQNLHTITWGSGFLNNSAITSAVKNYGDNYYTKEIPITIAKRIVVNN